MTAWEIFKNGANEPLQLVSARGLDAFVVKSDENVYTTVITGRDRKTPQRVVSLAVAANEPSLPDDIKHGPELIKRYQSGTILK